LLDLIDISSAAHFWMQQIASFSYCRQCAAAQACVFLMGNSDLMHPILQKEEILAIVI